MLPKTHFLTSVFVVSLLSFIFPLTTQEFFLWITLAGIVGVLLDLDHLLIPFFKKEKSYLLRKVILSPLVILGNIRNFREELKFKGSEWVRIYTHLLFSGIVFVFFFYFSPEFIIPVSASLLTHLSLDFIDAWFFDHL